MFLFQYREGTIYAAVQGMAEKAIGKGKCCTLTTINGKNVYVWVEDGDVVVRKPQGMKVQFG